MIYLLLLWILLTVFFISLSLRDI